MGVCAYVCVCTHVCTQVVKGPVTWPRPKSISAVTDSGPPWNHIRMFYFEKRRPNHGLTFLHMEREE